jgi:hypothetical protein
MVTSLPTEAALHREFPALLDLIGLNLPRYSHVFVIIGAMGGRPTLVAETEVLRRSWRNHELGISKTMKRDI